MDNVSKRIWDILMKKIENPYGVAGIMGNLYAESRMNASSVSGFSREADRLSYLELINTGRLCYDAFAHDGHAVGIAQWRYWSRKKALYEFAQKYWKYGLRIDDPEMQAHFLLTEIVKYKEVWSTVINATGVREASDIVLEKYERPATINETVKQKRATYGWNFYNAYAVNHKYIVTTAPKVNVRCGNGKHYMILDQIQKEGTKFPYIATADNRWHSGDYKVMLNGKATDCLVWISGEFSKVVEE